MSSRFVFCRDKFGEDLGNFIFENWSCFLDDCETLLEESKTNPNDLLSIWNSMNSSIQFTMGYCKVAIPFLDILIKCNNNEIWMDIYYKLADTHRCLLFSSLHQNTAKRIYLLHWHVVSAQLLKMIWQYYLWSSLQCIDSPEIRVSSIQSLFSYYWSNAQFIKGETRPRIRF